ncbi:hypothetical protein HPB49_016098 [Dermacentor silvarum]|uniref:Uncharacterized protein n=1 Tax=Dermacentor silvarum TaxID=543639 RepID=A0ACB8CA45_DERSI|nr:hypothetical protein HPB49_016098 [Dermacentor silvarum]
MASFQTRHFSTTGAVNAGLVKPPLAVFGIEGRYANALYSAASKEKKLDAVEKELVKFKGLMEQDTKLAQFLENPLVNKLVKRGVFQGRWVLMYQLVRQPLSERKVGWLDNA